MILSEDLEYLKTVLGSKGEKRKLKIFANVVYRHRRREKEAEEKRGEEGNRKGEEEKRRTTMMKEAHNGNSL